MVSRSAHRDDPGHGIGGRRNGNGLDPFTGMLDPATKDLRMLYVSTPQAALKKVRATPPGRTMGDLFEQLGSALIIELRVKFWHHTAVAHIIPSCPAMMNGHDSWASSFSRTAQPLATSAPAAAPAPP